MGKKIAVFLCCTTCLILLIGCNNKYSAEDFLGKTSAEIVKEFGAFDCITMPANDDGLYRNCRCGYTIKEAQKGFFGTSAEVLYFIVFDENGRAIECTEDYRPGD